MMAERSRRAPRVLTLIERSDSSRRSCEPCELPRSINPTSGDELLCSANSAGHTRRRLPRVTWQVISLCILLLFFGTASFARAEAPSQSTPPPHTANAPMSVGLTETLAGGPKAWTSPEGLGSSLQMMVLLTVLSLAPAALLMTTCYVRIVVVLSLLRQAIGTQNLPPTQVITTLALFLTALIMSPVWKQVYDESVQPYTQHKISAEQAWTAGVAPVRRFMSMQIERTQNTEDVWLFMNYLPKQATPKSYDDVPLQALLPAFMLSELKTAFLIGFQIYLPFLILDMVVASVTASMGMLMVPPSLVSLPLKLMLFVLVDGWRLVVGMLLQSFQPFT
jgi:flagellar biosynthesis protein FliP